MLMSRIRLPERQAGERRQVVRERKEANAIRFVMSPVVSITRFEPNGDTWPEVSIGMLAMANVEI